MHGSMLTVALYPFLSSFLWKRKCLSLLESIVLPLFNPIFFFLFAHTINLVTQTLSSIL